MVLELILAYGIVVGAIVGLSNVLPEYERYKAVAISEGKTKGDRDGDRVGPIVRQEDPADLKIEKLSERSANMHYDVVQSKKAGSEMDPDEKKKEEKDIPSDGVVKVADDNGEDIGDQGFSAPLSYPDVFQDQGYVEDAVTFEKWAK